MKSTAPHTKQISGVMGKGRSICRLPPCHYARKSSLKYQWLSALYYIDPDYRSADANNRATNSHQINNKASSHTIISTTRKNIYLQQYNEGKTCSQQIASFFLGEINYNNGCFAIYADFSSQNRSDLVARRRTAREYTPSMNRQQLTPID